MKKNNLLQEFETDYIITRINSHHGHRAIILEKRNLGTKSRTNQSTKMSEAHFGGNLGTK